jgi:NAD(P)H dehydrogenase (quinone)
MNVLVIYAHPVEDSFVAAAHRIVVEALTAKGHAVVDLDLYAEGFDPVMGREERLRYHDTTVNQAPLKRYLDMLAAAEGIVFVYPVWSFGVPAILKGFLDRCLMPGFAWDFTPDNLIEHKLTNIKTLTAVATYGRPWWTVKVKIGDLPKKQIMSYFGMYCAPGAAKRYLAHYHINRSTDASRAAFLERVRATMANL